MVGLGNPGAEYDGTRHNVGFAAVDQLAGRLQASFSARGRSAAVADGRSRSKGPFLLVKPLTYMNCSGEPLAMVLRDMGGQVEDLLAVVDDFNLDLGRLRLRDAGSDGGHNGLKSLIARLGTQDFARLRIGVGPLPARMPSEVFVLQRFKPAERAAVADTIERAAWAAEDWVNGIDAATLMNKYNGQP